MSYTVKEIYYTLQGEGAHAGRPAVFLRFAGCNLWTGRDEDRDQAVCGFCDTDFLGTDGPGGGKFASPQELASAVAACWPANGSSRSRRFVVCTGGEPLLQLDEPLVDALHAQNFQIAIESNGTKQPPRGIDWICVSPKAGADLVLRNGDELKLVFPQPGAMPGRYEHLEFDLFFLQPMDGPNLDENTRLALEYCLSQPQWSLSLQTHKLLRIP